tara:strand:+ start:7530 stop:7871 length:342 start_codon:yes stop_codon:yes gene_type:complete
MSRQIYTSEFMKGLSKNLLIVGVASLIYFGGAKLARNIEENRLINNPIGTKIERIVDGDTYDKIARGILESCPELETSKNELVEKIRDLNQYSPGNLPIDGEIVVPQYCQEER